MVYFSMSKTKKIENACGTLKDMRHKSVTESHRPIPSVEPFTRLFTLILRTWREHSTATVAMTSTIAKYNYEPLPAHNIRLLVLFPGSFGDDIHISLFSAELGIYQQPSYEALSYAWGSNDLDHNITVDSGESQQALPITRNLYTALQYLRCSTTQRTLWVDAICINQENAEERNYQVSRMADIYKSTEKVVIWLGPDENDSTLAIAGLDALASKIEVDWKHFKIMPATEKTDTVWLDLEQPAPFSEDIWRRVKPEIIDGLGAIVSRAWQICYLQGDATLRYVLEATKNAKCSDQRDRIYAILHLVNEQNRLRIQPNYSKSVTDVFRDVILGDIFKQGDALLLACCELGIPIGTMPSWIPNWSDPKVCVDIWEPRACSNSCCEAAILDGNVLVMTGVYAARITSRFSILPAGYLPPTEMADYLKSLVAIARGFLLLPRDQRRDEIICRTLCGNRFTDRYQPIRGANLDFQETMARFIKFVDETAEISSQYLADSRRFLDTVHYETEGRALIITDNGRSIGLAPRACRENDCIAVLLGCQSPLVLRETGAGNYLVVGECYVDGLMTGEALLGPLLDNWHRIARFDEATDTYWDAFVDRQHGIWEREDPRLGPLPEGWTRAEHPRQHVFTRFLDKTRGLKTLRDPRMRSSHLRERGIKLQQFHLV
ncbi:MAG: hypothetical protein Q9213_002158 [Squamulea squamosa]